MGKLKPTAAKDTPGRGDKVSLGLSLLRFRIRVRDGVMIRISFLRMMSIIICT